MPPKFRKAQTLKTVVDSDDAWDSQGEAHSEDRSSVEEESGEAEGSEDNDEGLEEMEKNPQALKKMFASEVTCSHCDKRFRAFARAALVPYEE